MKVTVIYTVMKWYLMNHSPGRTESLHDQNFQHAKEQIKGRSNDRWLKLFWFAFQSLKVKKACRVLETERDKNMHVDMLKDSSNYPLMYKTKEKSTAVSSLLDMRALTTKLCSYDIIIKCTELQKESRFTSWKQTTKDFSLIPYHSNRRHSH